MRCTAWPSLWRLPVVLLALFLAGCGPMMGQPQPQPMNLSGTLTRTQTSDGSPGTYYLSGMMGMNYMLDVSKVPSPDRYIGKPVAVTGTMDPTSSGSSMKIDVSKIEVMEGAPPPQR